MNKFKSCTFSLCSSLGLVILTIAVSDSAFSAAICGQTGTLEERIQDCAESQTHQGFNDAAEPNQVAWKRVSRARDGRRIWLDTVRVPYHVSRDVDVPVKLLWTDIMGGHYHSWPDSQRACESLRTGIPSASFDLPSQGNYQALIRHGGRSVFAGGMTSFEPVLGVVSLQGVRNDPNYTNLRHVSSLIFGGGGYVPDGNPPHFEAQVFDPHTLIRPPGLDMYLNTRFYDSSAFRAVKVNEAGEAEQGQSIDLSHSGYRCVGIVH